MDENNLQNLVKNLVEAEDHTGIDTLFVLAYSNSSKRTYNKHKNLLVQGIKNSVRHNSYEKYDLIKEDIDFDKIEEYCNLIPHEDFTNLQTILESCTQNILEKQINANLRKIRNEDAINWLAVHYVLKHIGYECNFRKGDGFGYKYTKGVVAYPRDSEEKEYIKYFLIEKLLFNLEGKNEIYSKYAGGSFDSDGACVGLDDSLNVSGCCGMWIQGDRNDYSLNLTPTLGDLLVKAGIGYWIPHVTSGGDRDYQFVVPKFLCKISQTAIKSIISPYKDWDNEYRSYRPHFKKNGNQDNS